MRLRALQLAVRLPAPAIREVLRPSAFRLAVALSGAVQAGDAPAADTFYLRWGGERLLWNGEPLAWGGS